MLDSKPVKRLAKYAHGNVVVEKSLAFAIRIVNLARYLRRKKEYVLSKQIIRSGTAIGALIREAQYAESRKDFVHKLRIGIKEANETCYWLELLNKTNWIEDRAFASINHDCIELIRILTAIINTITQNQIT